nr:hypothetical protein [Patescibacteria group bacterium]
MATTHDMRYENESQGDTKSSRWSWLLPLALIAAAAIALASYMANDNQTTTNGANGGGLT